MGVHGETYSDLREENTETGVFFPRASKRPSDQLEVFQALRDLEQRAQIKRISPVENTSREIQESGINPDKTLVELDFQPWKPKRTDFRKSETTFPRHYTMLEGARAGNDDHGRTGVLPPHPSLGGGGLQHLHLQGGGGGTYHRKAAHQVL